MKQSLKRLPLAVAILSVLGAAHSAAAQDEPTVALDTMNVTVDRQGAKSKTNVVTTAAKNKRTETDLRGLLDEEPAVTFGGGNGTSQWWTIRGMGQDQIDVKVDNAYSDAQMFHHQGRFMLDPSLVKIVEVQKGAGSASAGIGATSGAIVAKTLDAKELLQNSTNENFGAKISAGYQSNDGFNYGTSVFGKVGAVDALVSGNWIENDDYKGGDGYSNSYGSNRVKNSALDQRAYLAKVGLDIGSNNRLVASYREEMHKGVRSLREEFDFSQSNNDANNQPTYRETSTKVANLEWTAHDLGFVTRADANVYKMNVERYTPAVWNDIRQADADSTTEVETIGANLNLDSQIGHNTLLKYGINYRNQEAMPSAVYKATDVVNFGTARAPNMRAFGYDMYNQEKTDIGAYIEAIGQVGDVTLTGGLRYDYYKFKSMNAKENTGNDLNPSVGIIWQATPTLSFSANHNHATRSPRMFEAVLGSGYSGPRGNNSGGYNIRYTADNLRAEKARNTEVGFNYDNGNFSADGSYFWQTVSDAHGFRGLGGGMYEIANLGRVKNHGYEVGLGYRFDGALKGLRARAGVAYQEPETIGNLGDSTLYAVQIGRTWTGSLGYQLQSYPVEFGWRGRVVEDAVGTPSRGSSNSTSTQVVDGYNVHDFYVNWKPYHNDKMNVNFAINNAFDENYKPHSQRAGTNSLTGAGRDFRVGVNFTY